jgi:transcription antitermination factor NusG
MRKVPAAIIISPLFQTLKFKSQQKTNLLRDVPDKHQLQGSLPDKITVTMTTEKFKKHIIELVVRNGVALPLFSQPAFPGLNGEMAKKLGVFLEWPSIRKLIPEEAKNEKEELRKTLKGRFMLIKMDASTCHRVNYVAINARFVDQNNKMVTRTSGVKNIKGHHQSIYLQNLVGENLEDFEIKKDQILCLVTDNASNMLSTTEKMNKVEDEKVTTEGGDL